MATSQNLLLSDSVSQQSLLSQAFPSLLPSNQLHQIHSIIPALGQVILDKDRVRVSRGNEGVFNVS